MPVTRGGYRLWQACEVAEGSRKCGPKKRFTIGEQRLSFIRLIAMNVMFAGMLGGWEIILILAVVLILFGAKKLPELAKGLGTGIKEFKKATREVSDEMHSAMDDTPPPPAQKRLPTTTAEGTVPQSSSPEPKA
jgi:sec-independent protein translocase protein TatA